MIKVGIIGAGNHGSRYANHIVKDIEGLELTAISRRSESGREQSLHWDCRWYADWQALVADRQVEAVVACVPPAMNLPIARACAQHNKSLLVEKPLAVHAEAGKEIVEAMAAAGVKLTVGQTLRFNPVIRKLRAELGSIGTLFSFSANQRLEPSSLAWHDDPHQAGAGVSFHTAVHVFDALRFITGLEVRRVMAVVRRRHNSMLEDLLAVLVEMEGNVVGTLDCSKVGNARSGRFEFVGLEGQLQGDQVHHTLELVRGREITSLAVTGRKNTIMPLLENWRGYMAGERKNPVPGTEGLAAVRLCEAALESSRSGSWIEIARP